MLPVHAGKIEISEFIHVVCKERFGAKEAPCPVEATCGIQESVPFVADGYVIPSLPESFYLLKHLFRMVVYIDHQVIKSGPDKFFGRKFQHGSAVYVSQGFGSCPGHLTKPGTEARSKNHRLHYPSAVCFTDTSTPGIAESISATLSALQTER